MNLADLFLSRNLYKTQPQTLETQGAEILASNINPAPSTYINSGNTVTDINTNAQEINGAVIEPGTIPATTLDVSNFGWTQSCTFSVTDDNTIAWNSGSFISANGLGYSIISGDTGNMAVYPGKMYVYLDVNISITSYQITPTAATAVGLGKVLIAVCQTAAVVSAGATYVLVQASQITADNVVANSINASKINVGQISAISADLGSITAGTITGTLIRTSASGQRIEIKGSDNTLKFYDPIGQVIGMGTTVGEALSIIGTADTNNGVVMLSGVGGIGFYYENTANVSSTGLRIKQTNTGGNNSLSALNIDYAGSLGALQVANSGTGRSLYLIDSGTSGSVEGFHFEYARSGKAQEIITSHAAATGLYISSVSTSNAAIDLSVNTSSGNPVGIRMSINNSGGNEYAFEFAGSEIVTTGSIAGVIAKKVRILSGAAVYYMYLYDA